MATPAVCYPGGAVPGTFPALGLSTKGLHCDDPFARLISPDFVDRVDPKKLIMFLPPELLSPSDEDRVVSRQDSQGREEGARLLLALMARKGDWLPRLQQALRHREIRLEDLADKIDSLQSEVRMEIDFPDTAASDMLMEVDAEPWTDATQAAAPHLPPHPFHAAPTTQMAGLPELPSRMVSGRSMAELGAPGQGPRPDTQTILNQIAEHFFLRLAHSAEDVKMLTEQFERIASVMVTGYAAGCLEMRLRVATSRDLSQLRGLVESGVVQDIVERAVLTEQRREELKKAAAPYGLAWRRMNLKVAIEREDLDRCERFLKAREVTATPRTAAEALLQRYIDAKSTQPPCQDPSHTLPHLMLLFLHSLLPQPRGLAEQVASVLATSSLDLAIPETMAICRRHYGMSSELDSDLAKIALEMLEKAVAREEASSQETAATPQAPAEESLLYVEAPPQSPWADAVHRMTALKLMKPHAISHVQHAFCFVDDFVADAAFTCVPIFLGHVPEDYVSRALRLGSPFAVLHWVDFLLNLRLPMERFDQGLREDKLFGRVHLKLLTPVEKLEMGISSQLFQCMMDFVHPRTVTDFYLAGYRFLRYPACTPLFQRCWWTFGPEWKHQLRALLESGKPEALPDIRLCPVSNRDMGVLSEPGEQVLAASHTVDLTGKLNDLSRPQLRVLLACVQLTNVASFSLVKVGETAALRVGQTVTRVTTSSVGQPALKLCGNLLEDRHVECLLDALPGMEWVSHVDLSSCTITHSNLQRLLHGLGVGSVKTLVLNGISFSQSGMPTLPQFSHLKRLQSVELSSLGLQDSHMPSLALQLRELQDLRELSLEENHITTDGLSQLTVALAPCASLRVLRLRGCPLDAGSAYVLGAMLTPALSLHVLNLGHCPLQDSGLQHLSLVLHDHTQLTKVSLREGRYSPAGLASFLVHLRTCPRMQVLELGQCPLEEEGMDVSHHVTRALAASCHWDFLGLWQCRVGHTPFLQQLPDTLPTQLRSLSHLVLQDNDIDDTQVGYLADAIRQGVFRHLKNLNLRQSHIREAGAKRLAEALYCLPHMSQLLMQHSAVPMEGVLSLARAVLHLPLMTQLDLSDSCAMGHYDVTDAVTKIERLAQDEDIVIGVGVGYADGDAALEQTFIADTLKILGLKDSRSGAGKKDDPKADRERRSRSRRTKVKLPSERPSTPLSSEEEVLYDDAPVRTLPEPEAAYVLPPGEGYGDASGVMSPTGEQIAPGWPGSRHREITGRDMDALYFNDGLCISLGHQ